MRLRHSDLHGLTGVYALDALAGPELDRFTQHLGGCPGCEHEVRGFRETATQLALAVAATPPAHFRPRVLAAVAVTRQLPPEVPAARPPRARPSWRAWGGWFPRLATASTVVLAAGAIVAAVLLGIRQSHIQQELDQAQARSRALAAVLAAPDARLATAPVNTGGVLTVLASPRRHEAVVTTAGLPALTGSKVYQLWFVAGTSARSAGLLPRPVDGRTAPVLASGLVRGDVVALTVEPAGGTRKPTTTPIVAVPVR
jgi:hypothetical protein